MPSLDTFWEAVQLCSFPSIIVIFVQCFGVFTENSAVFRLDLALWDDIGGFRTYVIESGWVPRLSMTSVIVVAFS